MIIGGDFYYQGMLRWNLGWPTPNYAGAFAVTLLAFAFAFSYSRWRWAALAVEVSGFFLLAKTYSRGAVVAWLAVWVFVVVAGRVWRERGRGLFCAASLVMLGVMLSAAGFGWSRADEVGGAVEKLAERADGGSTGLTPVARLGDGSVVNRLALWRGGAVMMAAAPWAGWGASESGRVYMNWFQDVDRTEGFSTMVNSFLHVGVEYGLGALAVVVAVLGALLAMAWQVGRAECGNLGGVARSMRVTAAGASLVGWAVANVFTTLWIDWKLWIVPGVAVGIIVWNTCCRTGILPVGLLLRRAAFFGTGIALVGTLGLLLVGYVLAAHSLYRIEPAADGAISVCATAESASERTTWHLWPDPTVLGSTPGNSLRRWLATMPTGDQWIVHRANQPAKWAELSEGTGVILFGRQAERLAGGGGLGVRALRVIHPLGAPPAGAVCAARSTELILPAIDEAGNGPAWRAWAAANGAQLSESAGVGLDIRAAWPAVPQAGGAL